MNKLVRGYQMEEDKNQNDNNNNNNNVHFVCAISLYEVEHTAHYKYLYIHTINPENTVLATTTHNYDDDTMMTKKWKSRKAGRGWRTVEHTTIKLRCFGPKYLHSVSPFLLT